jgi:hypothetical protein
MPVHLFNLMSWGILLTSTYPTHGRPWVGSLALENNKENPSWVWQYTPVAQHLGGRSRRTQCEASLAIKTLPQKPETKQNDVSNS